MSPTANEHFQQRAVPVVVEGQAALATQQLMSSFVEIFVKECSDPNTCARGSSLFCVLVHETNSSVFLPVALRKEIQVD